MNTKLTLVLVTLTLAISGESRLLGNDGRGFPSTFDCKDNVDRTDMERTSVNINKEGRWLRRVDEFIQLPQTGGIFPGKIVCIEVIDLSLREVGGYVTRVGGGVGEAYAKLHVKSQLGKGLKFQITAYYEHAQNP